MADLLPELKQGILLETGASNPEITTMSGINFMVDERGEKTAVIIDLKRHKALWEDLYDAMPLSERAREPRESLIDVKQRLKRKRSPRD